MVVVGRWFCARADAAPAVSPKQSFQDRTQGANAVGAGWRANRLERQVRSWHAPTASSFQHFLDDWARDPDYSADANHRDFFPPDRFVNRPSVGPKDFGELLNVKDRPIVPLLRKNRGLGATRPGCGLDVAHWVLSCLMGSG
jgi:hypothetical protein